MAEPTGSHYGSTGANDSRRDGTRAYLTGSGPAATRCAAITVPHHDHRRVQPGWAAGAQGQRPAADCPSPQVSSPSESIFSTAACGTRYDLPTRIAGSSPECTIRYTVIRDTRAISATSATVRNRGAAVASAMAEVPLLDRGGRTCGTDAWPQTSILEGSGADGELFAVHSAVIGSRPWCGNTVRRVDMIARSTGSAGSLLFRPGRNTT